MPKLNWNNWHKGWAAILPKNRMWRKVRDGGHDESGEPTYAYPDADEVKGVTSDLGDVFNEHRFINPAVKSLDDVLANKQYCTHENSVIAVDDHGLHLVDEVNAHLGVGEGEGEGDDGGEGEGEGEGEA